MSVRKYLRSQRKNRPLVAPLLIAVVSTLALLDLPFNWALFLVVLFAWMLVVQAIFLIKKLNAMESGDNYKRFEREAR